MSRQRARLPLLASLLSAGLALAVVAAGCGRFVDEGPGFTQIGSAPFTEGSGKVATVSRALGAFTAVTVSTGLHVSISRGSTNTARVTADDNLLPQITTVVEGGTLSIQVTGSLTTHNRLEVELTVAQPLERISAGSGTSVDSEDLALDALTVRVSDGSTFRGGGRVTELTLTVSAGSTGDLRNVEARIVHVTVSSGSTARILATERVDGSCTSGSTLKIAGGPGQLAVESDTSSTVAKE